MANINQTEIECGDIVHVDINNAHITLTHEAIVIARPQATGDSWRFIDKSSGKLIYVSEGCTIILIQKGE